MKIPAYHNYDKSLTAAIHGDYTAWQGWDDIISLLKRQIPAGGFILNVDTYPGVYDDELIPQLMKLSPGLFINMKECFRSEQELNEQLRFNLTDDRVFGRMYFGTVEDLLDPDAVAAAREAIRGARGLVIIYGFGSRSLYRGDMLVFCDMARWEIQMRFRRGMGNYQAGNEGEDNLRKFKRGYFIEWRIADRHKAGLYRDIDFYLDTNRAGEPKLITGAALLDGLEQLTSRPFRTVPYFDPGVWGGQWMKEVCGLDPDSPNFAWAFDGVPEENSLYLKYGDTVIETPAMNLVLYAPLGLLGESVYARFGAEYPIRMDFLDTIGGQNLSLQVHPLTDYIHSQFGMAYTQDESYYILDADENACVYLGLREGIDRDEMLADLRRAQSSGSFDAEKYVNKLPAKKHDHFLIPAGTVHCSGSGAMVLEISATPYIFTFKLWDWGRLGLDGKPRPIHIDHGEKCIRWERTTDWVMSNLVDKTELLTSNASFTEERTGLHSLEFIESRRYMINTECEIDPHGSFNMLNLVEGREAVIESPDGRFEPFVVHYAETFIIPANAGRYRIRNCGDEQIGVVRTYVR